MTIVTQKCGSYLFTSMSGICSNQPGVQVAPQRRRGTFRFFTGISIQRNGEVLDMPISSDFTRTGLTPAHHRAATRQEGNKN